MTSESTRFLGQPREIKPTRGAGEEVAASCGGTWGKVRGRKQTPPRPLFSPPPLPTLFYVTLNSHKWTTTVDRGRGAVESRGLAVFAIEQVAHRAAAGGVDLDCGAALDVVGRGDLRLGRFFRFATGGTPIGEAGLAGVESNSS